MVRKISWGDCPAVESSPMTPLKPTNSVAKRHLRTCFHSCVTLPDTIGTNRHNKGGSSRMVEDTGSEPYGDRKSHRGCRWKPSILRLGCVLLHLLQNEEIFINSMSVCRLFHTKLLSQQKKKHTMGIIPTQEDMWTKGNQHLHLVCFCLNPGRLQMFK